MQPLPAAWQRTQLKRPFWRKTGLLALILDQVLSAIFAALALQADTSTAAVGDEALTVPLEAPPLTQTAAHVQPPAEAILGGLTRPSSAPSSGFISPAGASDANVVPGRVSDAPSGLWDAMGWAPEQTDARCTWRSRRHWRA